MAWDPRQPVVLFLDNHLLGIGKPAGFLSQADETGDPDVVTWCKSFIKNEFNKPGNVYCGLVHRLDRPASGVMILARTSKAASRLTSQWKQRHPKKRYLALVHGQPPEQGAWVDSLQKKGRTVSVVPAGFSGAKEARLEFRVLGFEKGLSLVQIELETGRPHQIRVQFASRGFPLLGDNRYGPNSRLDGKNIALHSFCLEFSHPVSKNTIILSWLDPLQAWISHFPSILRLTQGLKL